MTAVSAPRARRARERMVRRLRRQGVTDERVLAAMAAALGPAGGGRVLEVGPGSGYAERLGLVGFVPLVES